MWNRPAWRLFIIPNLFFGLLMIAFEASVLVNIVNAALFAIACGVVTAYFPIARSLILYKQTMDSADWLGLGVFCNWSAVAGVRLWSFLWRWAGKPEYWNDHQTLSYMLYLSCCGGIFHLVATQAVGNRMPTKRWLIIGGWVAAVVFTVMVLNFIIVGTPDP